MKKIGFDIHGVIDKNPSLFKIITEEFRELGYEIHVLTGSMIDKNITEELSGYDIKYDRLFSILDHHKNIDETEMWEDDRGWWIDDDIWNKTKGVYCKEHGLDFFLDDTKIYGRYFYTPFGHITPIRENPRILEIYDDVDDEILEVLSKHQGDYYKLKFL